MITRGTPVLSRNGATYHFIDGVAAMNIGEWYALLDLFMLQMRSKSVKNDRLFF